MAEMDTGLPHYDAMCRAIANAMEKALAEVDEIEDPALALELCVRMATNTAPEELCKKIRVRAERNFKRLHRSCRS